MTHSLHNQFLEKAVKLAYDNVAKHNGGPFGAVITRNNVIIATGTNQVTQNNDPSAHAEITAIRAACKTLKSFQLTDCIIYSSCEPCPMCLGAIYWARPKAVFFASNRNDAASSGFDDSFIYHEISLPTEKRSLTIQQLELSSHTQPFEAWMQNNHKKEY